MTSPDDENDRLREVDDTSAVPEPDRPRADPGGARADKRAGRPGGLGEVPTHSPGSEPMPGTAEQDRPVEGIFAPEGDHPAT
jgi:hypothetical protein